jgi:lipid-A-disaccharide synthase
VHVVSPSVWAWRAGRVKGIVAAVDLLLCLLPFEPAFYAAHTTREDFRAVFIGHPLAEELADPPDRAAIRAQLGIAAQARCVAVLPGSRGGELKYLAAPFAGAAAWIARQHPDVEFVVPVAKPSLRAGLERAIAEHAPGARWTLLPGQSREVMRAADAVLLASGTATLECLLLDRPMVVAYRLSPLNAVIARAFGLNERKHFSLPNLLGADSFADAVVPELIQAAATPSGLGAEVLKLLDDPAARERQLVRFASIRAALKQDAAARGAAAIAELLGR